MKTRKCTFTPAKISNEKYSSDWKRFIAEKRDPDGFSVKFINKTIGKGVFADQKWPKNSFLFEYAGELLPREEGLKRERTYPLHLGSFIFFFKSGKKDLLCIDATFSRQIGRFVNDGIGEERNAETKTIYVDETPHIGIFSTRNILPGEEIRYNYGPKDLPWRIADNQSKKRKHADLAGNGNDNQSKKRKHADLAGNGNDKESKKRRHAVLAGNGNDNQSKKRKQADLAGNGNDDMSKKRKHAEVYGKVCDGMPVMTERVKPIRNSVVLLCDLKNTGCKQHHARLTASISTSTIVKYVPDEINTNGIDNTNEKRKAKPLCPTSTTTSFIRAIGLQRKSHTGYGEEQRMETTHVHVNDRSEDDSQVKLMTGKEDLTVQGLSQDEQKVNVSDLYRTHEATSATIIETTEETLQVTRKEDLTAETQEMYQDEQNLNAFDLDRTHEETSTNNNETTEETLQLTWKEDLTATAHGLSQKEQIVNVLDLDRTHDETSTNNTETTEEKVQECEMSGDQDQEINYTLFRENRDDDTVVLHVQLERKPMGSSHGLSNASTKHEVDFVPAKDEHTGSSCKLTTDETEDCEYSATPLFQTGTTDMIIEEKESTEPREQEANTSCSNHYRNESQNFKGRKPHRPCPFCGQFRAKLSEHLKTKHRHEKEVKQAMTLPPSERNEIFSNLRKRGIYNENIKLIRNSRDQSNIKLIRERDQGNDKTVTCLHCKAFLAKSQFHKHRKVCNKQTLAETPRCMDPSFLTDMKRNEIYDRYVSEVLDKFASDDIGKLCREDSYIRAYGYQKFLSIVNRKRKRDEKRRFLMSSMRQVAKLYISFKECGDNAKKSAEDISILDMYKRAYISLLRETILSRKAIRSSSNLGDGYALKRFGTFLKDLMLSEGKDDMAEEIGKFLGSLSYNWPELFGEAECEAILKRSESRKPKYLPSENDIKNLKIFITDTLRALTEDDYNFIAESEYTLLRDLLVCRLTYFNARRGNEPSRLTIDEWNDAVQDVWLDGFELSDAECDENLKIAYQTGKNDGALVPVLFPSDCLKGLELVSDPTIRKDAGVNTRNRYLFPCTRYSEFHVVGSNSIDNVCNKAKIKKITATKNRHRAATMYASLDVCETERQAFYKHMGHSGVINRNVYQCPPAQRDITKVGHFLTQLDVGDSPRTANPSRSGKSQTSIEPSSNTLTGDSPRTANPSRSGKGQTSIEPSSNTLTGDSPLTANPSRSGKGQTSIEPSSNTLTGDSPRTANPSRSGKSQTSIESSSNTLTGDSPRKANPSRSGKSQTSIEPSSNTLTGEKGQQRNSWSKEDTAAVNKYFHKYVYDISTYDSKGPLPGNTAMRHFLKSHPTILMHLPLNERLRTLHAKIYNERNKSRAIAKKELLKDDVNNKKRKASGCHGIL